MATIHFRCGHSYADVSLGLSERSEWADAAGKFGVDELKSLDSDCSRCDEKSGVATGIKNIVPWNFFKEACREAISRD